MEFKVNRKETVYFVLRIIFTVIGLGIIYFIIKALSKQENPTVKTMFYVYIFYAVLIIVYLRLVHWFMISHLKGNGVLINENQFPNVNKIIIEIAESYKMKKTPSVFLVQSGGVLNAYATRFAGRNYVAIYSEIFSMVETDPDVLKFIIAHEFAHIKRNHIQKRFWTMLSFYVPFLGSAYSRSCEYTCDSFGNKISHFGSTNGLLVLAAGKDLYKNINTEQYVKDFKKLNTIGVKFAEIFMSHPNLPKRIINISESEEF